MAATRWPAQPPGGRSFDVRRQMTDGEMQRHDVAVTWAVNSPCGPRIRPYRQSAIEAEKSGNRRDFPLTSLAHSLVRERFRAGLLCPKSKTRTKPATRPRCSKKVLRAMKRTVRPLTRSYWRPASRRMSRRRGRPRRARRAARSPRAAIRRPRARSPAWPITMPDEGRSAPAFGHRGREVESLFTPPIK